jgi:hypothetical protein
MLSEILPTGFECGVLNGKVAPCGLDQAGHQPKKRIPVARAFEEGFYRAAFGIGLGRRCKLRIGQIGAERPENLPHLFGEHARHLACQLRSQQLDRAEVR